MNFDKKTACADLNDLFDCRGNELAPRRDDMNSDGCPLAMVYGIKQQFVSLYDPETGLAKGTVFSELDLPFKASEGGRKC